MESMIQHAFACAGKDRVRVYVSEFVLDYVRTYTFVKQPTCALKIVK